LKNYQKGSGFVETVVTLGRGKEYLCRLDVQNALNHSNHETHNHNMSNVHGTTWKYQVTYLR
jgi:hypothetical protein